MAASRRVTAAAIRIQEIIKREPLREWLAIGAVVSITDDARGKWERELVCSVVKFRYYLFAIVFTFTMDFSRVFPKATKSAVSSAFSLLIFHIIGLRVRVGGTSVVSYCVRRYVPLLIIDIYLSSLTDGRKPKMFLSRQGKANEYSPCNLPYYGCPTALPLSHIWGIRR